jgi:hypothetical protein
MRFNLDNYATVAERLAQFHKDFPDGRIITTLIGSNDMGNGNTQWVVRAEVFLTAGDQANGLAKGTGFAAEIDNSGGANNVAALPNAETSAIGRGLMSIGYSMNKDPKTLASREEMQKVERVSAKRDNWLIEADKISDLAGLRWLYAKAKSEGASPDILERIETRAKLLSPDVESPGAYGGLSDGPADGADK